MIQYVNELVWKYKKWIIYINKLSFIFEHVVKVWKILMEIAPKHFILFSIMAPGLNLFSLDLTLWYLPSL